MVQSTPFYDFSVPMNVSNGSVKKMNTFSFYLSYMWRHWIHTQNRGVSATGRKSVTSVVKYSENAST